MKIQSITSLIIVSTMLLIGCDQPTEVSSNSDESQLAAAKLRFGDRVNYIKGSALKDWFGKPENVRYDIVKSDSVISPYDGILYLTHLEGNYTASYTFQCRNGIWWFLKSDSDQVPEDIDSLVKRMIE